MEAKKGSIEELKRNRWWPCRSMVRRKKKVHGGKGVITKYVETETNGGKRTTQ